MEWEVYHGITTLVISWITDADVVSSRLSRQKTQLTEWTGWTRSLG